MADNRPQGRKTNVTGQSTGAYRRGDGLNTGPVGKSGSNPFNTSQSSSKPGMSRAAKAGGGTDLYTRYLTQALGEVCPGVNFVVNNYEVSEVGMETVKATLYPLLVEELAARGVALRAIYERNEAALREKEGLPYVLSVGIGWSRFAGEGDTFQACMHRADQQLYEDKAREKQRIRRRMEGAS